MNETPISPRLFSQEGKEYPLAAATIFGRAPECTIRIDDAGVSRQHAQIELSEGKAILKDLDSQNGTFVNDLRIRAPTELKDGDQIRINNSLFTYKAAGQAVDGQAGNVPTAAFEAGIPGETLQTRVYQSIQLLTLIRSDNGAEIGLNCNMQIGRAGNNDICLPNDHSASQTHAKIELVNGQVVLTDLNSRNGTWVNGVRITTPVALSHGDKLQTGNTIFRLRAGDKPLPPLDTAPPSRSCWLVGCGSLLAGGTILAIALAAFSFLPQIIQWSEPPTPTPTATLTPTVTATSEPTEIPGLVETQQAAAEQQALRALVLVLVKTVEGTYGGSGSMLDSRGYILTNFHVMGDPKTGKLFNPSEKITIGLNWNNPEEEPDTFYKCEIVKFDADYDLALLQVVSLSNGDTLPGDLTFPTLPIGDSDNLRIGDPIAVLGYPALGGKTPTFTRGTVSGFLADNHIDQERGWIKTDAEINRGNSGGMAINSKGELIGVPTQATFDLEVTGKISDIRPINLARAVMDAIP